MVSLVSPIGFAGTPFNMTATSSNSFAAGESPSGRTTRASARAEALVMLDNAVAADPAVVGTKAANLARARAAGLPTLPGVVVTVGADVAKLVADPERLAAILREHLGDGPLIARSSSAVEDSPQHSMAGRFDTIADLVDAREIAAGKKSSSRLTASAERRCGPALAGRLGGVA